MVATIRYSALKPSGSVAKPYQKDLVVFLTQLLGPKVVLSPSHPIQCIAGIGLGELTVSVPLPS